MLVFRPIKFWRRCRGWEWFKLTFLLTFSSLFWCAGQSLQELNTAEQPLALHHPALESKDPDSKVKSRKCDFSRASATNLWHLCILLCWALFIVIANGSVLLLSYFDCLHTAIIKKLKYGIWTLLKRFRHLHFGTCQFNSNILYFVLLLWSGLRCTYGIAYSIGQTRGWFTHFLCYFLSILQTCMNWN